MAGRRGLFGAGGADDATTTSARASRYVTDDELRRLQCWVIVAIAVFGTFAVTISVAYIARSVIDAHDISHLSAATGYGHAGRTGASVVLDAPFLLLHGHTVAPTDVVVVADDIAARKRATDHADIGGMLITGPGERALYYEHVVSTAGPHEIRSSITLRPPASMMAPGSCVSTPGWTISRSPVGSGTDSTWNASCPRYRVGINTPAPQCHLDVHDDLCVAGTTTLFGRLAVCGTTDLCRWFDDVHATLDALRTEVAALRRARP